MKTHALLGWLAGLGVLLAAGHLAAEETAVVRDGRVNVRGQPSLVGEVITQLQKGEKVVVLEEITSASPKTNEPAKWARIQMPANTPVWVYAPMVDPANKTVKASRLNLRAGPGENYSVVGRLERGAAVRQIRQVEDWMEIEPPPGAYGFVAANLLTKIPGGSTDTIAKTDATKSTPPPAQLPGGPNSSTGVAQPPLASAPSQPSSFQGQPLTPSTPPAQTPSTSHPARPVQSSSETVMQPLVQPSTRSVADVPPAPALASGTVSNAVSSVPPVSPSKKVALAAPGALSSSAPQPIDLSTLRADRSKVEDKIPRRVVRREGIVRSTVSIQAPTYYELLSPANRKTINYLHTENLGIKMKDYRGRRIIVTGEEAIDPRWPNTPVIEVETLELIP